MKRQTEYVRRSLDFTETLLLGQTVQVAVGFLSLPRVLAEQAGHDGWMAIPVAGLFAQVGIAIIIVLMRRFPNEDLYGILRHLFGRWVGRFVGALFALYCLCAAALVARTYIELMQTWLFPTTQPPTFFVLLLFPCVYAATGGIRVLGRYGVATFFGTVWMMLLLFGPGSQMHQEYFLPFFESSWVPLLKATWQCSASLLGFELILVYYPFIQKKEKAMLACSLGSWMTIVIYLVTTVVAFGFYSEPQIIRILSPTLHLYKVIELPLIERLEHIGIALWSFLVVNTVSTYLWSSGRFLTTFQKWKEPTCIYLLLPLLIAIGLVPQDAFLLNKFEMLLGVTGAFVSLLFPALLLLIAIIFRKRGEEPTPAAQPTQEVNAS